MGRHYGRLGASIALALIITVPIAYLILSTGASVTEDRPVIGPDRPPEPENAGYDPEPDAVTSPAADTQASIAWSKDLPADSSFGGATGSQNDLADRTPSAREALAEMRRTCEYWTGQIASGDSSARDIDHQRAACRRMREYALETGLSAPRIALAEPPSSKPDRKMSSVTVYFNTCNDLTYGSIDYRRCRAEQKAKLDRECKDARKRARQAGGSQDVARLNDTAEAWCVAYADYDIVR